MLVVVVEEARNTIAELQEDLISARDTILDLSETLSESHRYVRACVSAYVDYFFLYAEILYGVDYVD